MKIFTRKEPVKEIVLLAPFFYMKYEPQYFVLGNEFGSLKMTQPNGIYPIYVQTCMLLKWDYEWFLLS